MKAKLTRRTFLSHAAVSSAVIPLALVFPACLPEPKKKAPTQPVANVECDLKKLSTADLDTRKAMQYVEKSTDPAKNCGNCMHKIESGCLGCKLFKGPVERAGTCATWVAES